MHEFPILHVRPARARVPFRLRVRRVIPRVLVVGLASLALGVALSAPAVNAASKPSKPSEPDSRAPQNLANFVDVIDVNGYIDRVMRDFIVKSIENAVADHSQALVIQLNSPGSLLSDRELASLEAKIRDEHRIPITVWVGGLNARAKGGAARIVGAADLVGVSKFVSIGNAPSRGDVEDPLVGRIYNDTGALKAKIAQVDAPVLVQFVTELDGRTLEGKVLDTAYPTKIKDTKTGQEFTRNRPYGVRFAKIGLIERLLHMATNPSIAYLFVLIGLSLFVFEFFTGGIGIAAVVGLLSFVLGVSGLGNLPTRPLGVLLLLLAMLGFSIDIQAGTPRFWTGVGSVSLVLGSLLLYNGPRVPIYWIAIMTVLVILFMVNGMPTMVRTRFATPTIGRESMIGELGEAKDAVSPEGVVTINGAPWRARTNRATPIGAGEPVRVVAIDGLLLEVEPLEGAAKDHRG
jgi:membrane-bound serine protease (ClpP class)